MKTLFPSLDRRFLAGFAVIFFAVGKVILAQSVVLDTSFGEEGIVRTSNMFGKTSEITSLDIQADGKIVATGYLMEGTSYHFQLARYHSNGSLDRSFGNEGIVHTAIHNSDMPYTVAVQPDKKIVVAGNYYTGTSDSLGEYHSVIVRYNIDGTLDYSFGSNGIVTTVVDSVYDHDAISSLILQSDGKILVCGSAGRQAMVMRYQTNGVLDTGFGDQGGIVLISLEEQTAFYDIALQPNGKIIVSGATGHMIGGIENFKLSLMRFNTGGTRDSSFGSGGEVIMRFDRDTSFFPSDRGYALALQPDGKIVVAGYSGGKIGIARFNRNGSPDHNFATEGKYTSSGYPGAIDIAIGANEEIITCGNLNNHLNNTANDFSLTKFTPQGMPDSSFGTAGLFSIDIASGSDYPQSLLLQQDGKIVIGGSSADSSESSPPSFTMVRVISDLYTHLSDIQNPSALHVYPNPANTFLFMDIQLKKPQDFTITIMDLQGKVILSESVYQKAKYLKKIDLSTFNKGAYILKMETSSDQIFNKVIVDK